jgi:hypothetical protein
MYHIVPKTKISEYYNAWHDTADLAYNAARALSEKHRVDVMVLKLEGTFECVPVLRLV